MKSFCCLFEGADLEKTREIIGEKLDIAGFMEVRKYIFGDHPMILESEALGIPYCGGYAVDYQYKPIYAKPFFDYRHCDNLSDGDRG